MNGDRTAQDALVNDQLELLHDMQLAKMSPEELLQWQGQIDDMKDRYREARKREDDKALSKAERDYAGKVGENIAKALPVVSRGIITAQKAFAKGDYVTGAAAIMDICAAAAPVISSLLAAAGPEGMLVGALFSVIGQILSLFAPKEPSQIAQIETLLKDLANERELEHIKAVHDEVTTYASTLIKEAHGLRLLLKQPLKNHKDSSAFHEALKATTIVLTDLKPQDSVTSFNTWTVIEYLKNDVNQDVAKWPEVLGVLCQTYSDLVAATMTITLLANNDDIRRRLDDVDPAKEGPLSTDDKKEIENLLLDLQSYAKARMDEYASFSATMLRSLEAITPAARDRGLYVHLGDNNYLYGATGRTGMKDGAWKRLDVSGGNLSTRFSITVPKSAVGSLTPQYHLFVGKAWVGGTLEVTHAWLDTKLNAHDEARIADQKFADIWALPAPKDQKPRGEGASFVYAAHDAGGSGSVQLFELDGNSLTPGGWQPATKAGVTTVRAVTHPPVTLADDPDKGGLPPGSLLLGGVDHYNSIIYGSLHASPDIYVDQSNTRNYAPSPWSSYTGIVVDPYYLWVFRPDAFACATHASVISCVLGKRPSPRWMSYAIPGEYLFDSYQLNVGGLPTPWETSRDRQRDHGDKMPPLKGLVAFTACRDGMLLASMFKRKVYHPDKATYDADDSLLPSFYTSVVNIDLAAGRLDVDPWKLIGGGAFQVQKIPIPCWSLFEKLKADLGKAG